MNARSIAIGLIVAMFAVPGGAQAPAPTIANADKPKSDKPKSDKPKSDKPKSAGPKAVEPLFQSADIVQLTIKGPIGSLTGGRSVPEPGVPATLTVAGSADALPVTLAPRGITRRKRDTCPFPPLWVTFTEKPPATSVFKGQKKLKLVTHCRQPESFQQYVLLEYAAYRLYQLISPASFAVRLARIDYIEASGKPVVSRTGFLIEDGDEVAKRNQLAEFKGVTRIRASQLDSHAAARVAMFQYLIGNLDWAMIAGPPGEDCCHNARLFGAKGATSALVPAPYDFDYSGFVDAPYAVPPEQLNINNVRTRRYRGYCVHNAELASVAAEFQAKRPQLLAAIDSVPQLDAGAKAKARKYVEGFYEDIASPAAIAENFEKTCLR
jgi:hypothetical protein